MNEPDLKKAKRNCDCKTGRLSKMLTYDEHSKLTKRATHHWCTFKCMNCRAMWKAESWLRGTKWTPIKWTKTKAGFRA